MNADSVPERRLGGVQSLHRVTPVHSGPAPYPPGMPRVCTRRMLIHDIDAAGIAFTGRLVTIALEALETGLSDVGMDFAAMLREKKFGVPLVHIEADFKRPFRHGERVDIDLWCIEIKEHSYTCRIDLLPASGTMVAASLSFTAAVIEMATFTSVPMPEHFRVALQRLAPPPLRA